MTVEIGNLRATFANTDLTYTAIGMHVDDQASSNTSKLLQLVVNSNSVFSISKYGGLRVSSNVYTEGSNNLFYITNQDYNVIKTQANNITYGVDTLVHATAHVKSYTEGYKEIETSGSLTIDLNEASVFRVTSSTGQINSIEVIRPNVATYTANNFSSFSIIFVDNITISESTWTDANFLWPSGSPQAVSGDKTIFTFFSDPTNNNWFSINSGQNFLSV